MEKYKYCNIGRARQLSSGGREGGREGKGGRQQRVSIAQKGETTHVKGMFLAGYLGGCCVRIKTESEPRIRV